MARKARVEATLDTPLEAPREPEAARSGPEIAPTRVTLDPPRWRSSLAGPFGPLRMAALGVRRTFGLLLAVTLGMLAATVLICTVPLYTGLDSQVQVYHTLATAQPYDANVQVDAKAFTIQPGVVDPTFAQTDALAHRWIGGFTTGPTRLLVGTDDLRITAVNGMDQQPRSGFSSVLPPDPVAGVYGFDFTQAAPHMQLFAGQFPQDNPADGVPQVLVTNRMTNVHAGDTLTLVGFGNDSQTVTVRVAGIWYPKDENEPFWNQRSFNTLYPPNPADPTFFPIVFSLNTFVGALTFPVQPGHPPLGMQVESVYYTDPSRVSAGQLTTALANVKTFRAQLNGDLPGHNGVVSVDITNGLETILAGLQSELSVLSLPLYVVVAQLVGLALLFVVAMAGALIDGQTVEIATLKSRGASGAQLLLGYALQGLLLAAIAAVLAPLLAAQLSIALVRSFIPSAAGLLASPVGQRFVAGAAVSPTVLLPAAAGALLSVGAVVVAALRSARLDVLSLRREEGRTTAVPFWKRYYLDLALAALAAVGYFELGQFGSLGTRTALSAASSSGSAASASGPDPLLLAAPALLLLAGALLALRLFPLAASLGARLAARGRGAVGMLAFAQVERGSDASFSRLTLLLTLAVGLGLFALGFQASLAQNARDRAAYLTGGDELVRVGPVSDDTGALADRYAKLPGVLASTPVYRTFGSDSDFASDNASLLAIDPNSFASVAHWRDDYASLPLQTLMAQLRLHEQGAHAGESGHPLWVLLDQTFANNFHLQPGDRLFLATADGDARIPCVVGAIVNNFPTMFDGQLSGYVILDINDYFVALANPAIGSALYTGPNEYWLRTSDDPTLTAARDKTLGKGFDPNLLVLTTAERSVLAAQFATDPLAAGMSGLLLVGAATAAALAVLGSLVQAGLSARRRARQFAILRTLGTSGAQLVRMLLDEQLMVYLFGLIGGTALGLVLSTATLPFLQFSSALASPAQVGVPPYVLVFNGVGAAIFYGALLVAFVVALLLSGRIAARVGLGTTLRLGED